MKTLMGQEKKGKGNVKPLVKLQVHKRVAKRGKNAYCQKGLTNDTEAFVCV